MSEAKKRILTGDRPTGKPHIGHWVGSFRHRVAFQEQYECFFIVADLHMLTTKPDKESILQIADNARALVLAQLAVGINPETATFYLQSAVPEIYDLQLLLSSLITVERIQQLPQRWQRPNPSPDSKPASLPPHASRWRRDRR